MYNNQYISMIPSVGYKSKVGTKIVPIIDPEHFLNTNVYIQSKRSLLSRGEKSYLYLCNNDISVCGDGYKSPRTIWNIVPKGNMQEVEIINFYRGRGNVIWTHGDKVMTNAGLHSNCVKRNTIPFVGSNNPFTELMCEASPYKPGNPLFTMEVIEEESTPNRLAVRFRRGNRYLSDQNGGLKLLNVKPSTWETFYLFRIEY